MWEDFASASERHAKATQGAALAFWAAVAWTAALYVFSFIGTTFGMLPPQDGTIFNAVMKCAVVLVPLLLLASVVIFVKDDAWHLVVALMRRASQLPDILRQLVAQIPTVGAGIRRVAAASTDSISVPRSTVLQRLTQLEEENAQLRNMIADLSRNMEMLQNAVRP
jgi:hypothetical protein